MSWQLEASRKLLQITHYDKDGRGHIQSNDDPRKTPDDNVCISFDPEDVQITVEPYRVDDLYQDVQITSPDFPGAVNRILVGVRDEERLAYVGRLWTPTDSVRQRAEKYFFRNDRPSSFNAGVVSGPGWPSNGVMTAREVEYLRTLPDMYPRVRRSLENCMRYILIPENVVV
jgi:hypothetical protein